jgi:predicted PurR-regulated permease PerM
VDEVHEIDPERLNTTVIGLAIRLAFLGIILFLSLSIIRPFFETVAWSIVWAVAIYPVFDLVARFLRLSRPSKTGP